MLEFLWKPSQPFTPCHIDGVTYREPLKGQAKRSVNFLRGLFGYSRLRPRLLTLAYTRLQSLVRFWKWPSFALKECTVIC